MPELATLSLFLSAAFILAITPGPGIFYVLTRSLKGGKSEGIASALGTSAGGMFHAIAAAFGISVVLATSAVAFSAVKYLGAAYLVYLGLKTILSRDPLTVAEAGAADSRDSGREQGRSRAFWQGGTVEALNPKTALFFLAFIPQFVDPAAGAVFIQFLVLGTLSVLLNTLADFVVIALAGPIGHQLKARPKLRRAQRYATGTGLIALGSYVAFAGEGEG